MEISPFPPLVPVEIEWGTLLWLSGKVEISTPFPLPEWCQQKLSGEPELVLPFGGSEMV